VKRTEWRFETDQGNIGGRLSSALSLVIADIQSSQTVSWSIVVGSNN
jgi:hypothetical protein